MDWHEYLEQATAGFRLNAEAAAVRRELLAHLEALALDIGTAGVGADAAREEACRRMGDPAELRAAFAVTRHPPRARPWLAAVAGVFTAAFAIPTFQQPLLLAGVIVAGTLTVMAARPRGSRWADRWRQVGAEARHWRREGLLAGAMGAILALAPLWLDLGRIAPSLAVERRVREQFLAVAGTHASFYFWLGVAETPGSWDSWPWPSPPSARWRWPAPGTPGGPACSPRPSWPGPSPRGRSPPHSGSRAW